MFPGYLHVLLGNTGVFTGISLLLRQYSADIRNIQTIPADIREYINKSRNICVLQALEGHIGHVR